MRKIVIGTANFNQVYGIQKFKLSKFEIKKKIIKIINKSRIKYFDTAFEYNLSNSFLKYLSLKDYKIITKIKLPKRKKKLFLDNLEKNIKKETKKYNVKYFDYMLFHNTNDLKNLEGEKLLKSLINLKKKKIIKKIGVSIYHPQELKFILRKFKPDLIQAPLNIFDNRIIKSKFFKYILNSKIELQVRSIFLQGLILKSDRQLKKLNVNPKLREKIKNFDLWCKKNNISKIEACALFIKSIKGIKYITVGFNSSYQLLEILKSFAKNKKIVFKNFTSSQNYLIDPRKW